MVPARLVRCMVTEHFTECKCQPRQTGVLERRHVWRSHCGAVIDGWWWVVLPSWTKPRWLRCATQASGADSSTQPRSGAKFKTGQELQPLDG
jgi:hypothetical protein